MDIHQFITRIFFPKRCSICGNIIPLSNEFCNCSGEEEVILGTDFCHHCGYNSENCICSETAEIHLPHITAVYLYSGKIRQQICAFKFEGEKQLYKDFALKMCERVATVYSEIDFDFVTFVPTTNKVKRERGFNQSELLAREIAKHFFIPCKSVLFKTKDTFSQHNLNAKERISNLIDSISCTENIQGKTVLLCDDVKTTGATLSECVKALKSKGACDVYCICIALSEYSRDIF